MAATAASAAPSVTDMWPTNALGGWTVERLNQLPESPMPCELIDGVLVVSPAPKPRHQVVLGELYLLLRAACPPDLRVFVAPVDWQPDGQTSLQPDLLAVRRDRIDDERMFGAPSLAVEIISPSSRWIDRGRKLTRYAEGGIEQYWIVEPGDAVRPASIEVYDLVDGAYSVQARGEGAEVLTVTGPVPVTVCPRDLVTG